MNVKIDLELVDKVREFLITRWTINFSKNDSTAIPVETLNKLLPTLEPITFSSVMSNLETVMNDSLDFVIPRLVEFGVEKDYVIELINNQNTGPGEVLEFVNRFKSETNPIN